MQRLPLANKAPKAKAQSLCAACVQKCTPSAQGAGFVQGEADTPTVLTEQESIISCCLRLATPTIARLAALHPTHAAYVCSCVFSCSCNSL